MIANLAEIEAHASTMAGHPVRVVVAELVASAGAHGRARWELDGRYIDLDAAAVAKGGPWVDYLLIHEAAHHRLGHCADPVRVASGKVRIVQVNHPDAQLRAVRSISAAHEDECDRWVLDNAHKWYTGERLASIRQYAMTGATMAGLNRVGIELEKLNESMERIER